VPYCRSNPQRRNVRSFGEVAGRAPFSGPEEALSEVLRGGLKRDAAHSPVPGNRLPVRWCRATLCYYVKRPLSGNWERTKPVLPSCSAGRFPGLSAMPRASRSQSVRAAFLHNQTDERSQASASTHVVAHCIAVRDHAGAATNARIGAGTTLEPPASGVRFATEVS